MLRYLLHWEFKLELFTPTHTRVRDEELDRKEYDKNNLITITTLNLVNTQCALHEEETRQRDFVQFNIYFLHFFFCFLLPANAKPAAKPKHNRNNKVETALMNENAGGQTRRQKQTLALSPHCKNANANCKFQLERNSLLCSLKNSSLLIPPTRTYVASGSAMCARRSLFVYSML